MEPVKDEKQIRILNLLSERPDLSQRAIASKSGLSLGLVNLTLKRLIQTGHIKISNLSSKKVEYILTPKGFMEKANHSYAYLSRTLKVFLEYQNHLLTIIDKRVKEGNTSFAVLGTGEIADLAIIALRNHPRPIAFRHVSLEEPRRDNEVILDCRVNGKESSTVGISVLSALLEGSRVGV